MEQGSLKRDPETSSIAEFKCIETLSFFFPVIQHGIPKHKFLLVTRIGKQSKKLCVQPEI